MHRLPKRAQYCLSTLKDRNKAVSFLVYMQDKDIDRARFVYLVDNGTEYMQVNCNTRHVGIYQRYWKEFDFEYRILFPYCKPRIVCQKHYDLPRYKERI